MWYVAHLLFAQKPRKHGRLALCETCDVLISAKSALACYDKALVWAKDHETDNSFHFVGVQHLRELNESKRPDDGSEIGGRFVHILDVWSKKRRSFIPPKQSLNAIVLERNMNTPIKELMTPQLETVAREMMGEQPKRRSSAIH